ncbi:MAG: ferrochelatase [Phycisphaerales bacterium]|nr:ferrochelatase [Phycisphaerales bacterium]
MSQVYLLMNLGTPDSPNVSDVSTYLDEFLMDERVLGLPNWLRSIIVRSFIVPRRAPKSAAKYGKIWQAEGSPIKIYTQKIVEKIKERNKLHHVYYCMRYGNPSVRSVMQEIHERIIDIHRIIVLPLYPHYAMSSYETAVEQVKLVHKELKCTSLMDFVNPFYNQPLYIEALSNTIKPYIEEPFDHLLFSYHGLPESHIKSSDCTQNTCLIKKDCCLSPSPAHKFCYKHQIVTTTNLVAQQLGIAENKFSYSFQSRLGFNKWLKPFTTEQLKNFPKNGVRKLLVVCPAFVSDCLETLEEINIEGRKIFLDNGGESFTYIPCLNLNEQWIDCIEKIFIHESEKLNKIRFSAMNEFLPTEPL